MGIVTHILRTSPQSLHQRVSLILILEIMRRDDNLSVHGSSNNFDNLDKAFVIFKIPGPGRLHRRVDFISAPKERYSAAILSWSGSMMFERDLK
jgi:DNA polymerase mu